MFAEYEQHCRRLVRQICGILQAEKCLIMLYDSAAGILFAVPPALGFSLDELFRLGGVSVIGGGVSPEVYRDNVPVRLEDAGHDPRAIFEGLAGMGIRNGVSIPLVSVTRDGDGRLLTRKTIGVLHVFNKCFGADFIDEDVRLLQSMAMTAVAIVMSF